MQNIKINHNIDFHTNGLVIRTEGSEQYYIYLTNEYSVLKFALKGNNLSLEGIFQALFAQNLPFVSLDNENMSIEDLSINRTKILFILGKSIFETPNEIAQQQLEKYLTQIKQNLNAFNLTKMAESILVTGEIIVGSAKFTGHITDNGFNLTIRQDYE